MSDLFALTVRAVAGDKVRFHVRCVQHDPVPPSKNFALSIIVDAFWIMKNGFFYDKQPLTRVEAALRIAAHPRHRELAELLELQHGKDVVITEAEHDALRADKARIRAEGLCAVSTSRRTGVAVFTKTYPTLYADFIERAERDIVDVVISDEHEPPTAEGKVSIKVRNPAFLAHLAPGFTWRSAIYDFDGWA